MLRLLFVLQALAPQGDPAPRAVFRGFRGEVEARAPRLDAEVTIDGALDERVWGEAAVLTDFSQLTPVDGRRAEDSTDILVWHSPTAIYFGVRAYEAHGIVNATLADRDRIESDDRVEILLDTFNDRRLALSFAVNPLGVQADGFRNNSPIPTADFTTDFVYQSKGRLTEYGYEVEVRIPFKSIRFQALKQQDWGLNILRLVQHSGYQNSWTPARLDKGPLVGQSGMLRGLSDLKRGLVLDVNPFTVGKMNGARAAAGHWAYDRSAEFGANARWGITPNLALDAAVNPDFSQVEADAGQIPADARFALFFAETRPFFLDGIDKFATLNRLIYTRRLADPVAALKLTGKFSGLDVGFISGVDDRATSATRDNPVYNLLRVRRDFGRQSTAGFAYTDKIDGSAFNRVAEGDIHIVWKRQYFVDLQGAASFDRASATSSTVTAPQFYGVFDCTGRVIGCRYGITGIHRNFRAASGFVNRTGFIDANSLTRVTLAEGRPGATIEKLNVRATTNFIWNFSDFNPTEMPRETRTNFAFPTNIRGGWLLTPSLAWETYRFDSADYRTYAVETTSPVDTVPFAVPPRINDVWRASFRVTTPQFARFGATGGMQAGMDAVFFEPARARFLAYDATVDWRPNSKIRVNASYTHARRNRERDDTRFSTQHIPRLKIEYQLSRPIFVRFVGQYNIDEQDALRDPRTDEPILLATSGGTFTRSAIRRTNDLRIDWLFSFNPVPGTVVYFGYGASLTEANAFTFDDVRRVRDGFFVKLSYLFRN